MSRLTYYRIGLLNAMVIVSGCTSISSIPEDHFYRLSQIDPVITFSESKLNEPIVVERVKAYGIYHERAILYAPESTPETLKYHHYHHWIDKPATLIREQLIQYLRKSDISEYVLEGNGRQDDGVHLLLTLKKFERQLKSKGGVDVNITASIRITLNKYQAPILYKDYSMTKRAEDSSMPATIRAFNSGLGDIYQKMTDDLIESIKSNGI